MITDLYTHLIEYYNLFVMKIEGCIMGVLIMAKLKSFITKVLSKWIFTIALWWQRHISIFFLCKSRSNPFLEPTSTKPCSRKQQETLMGLELMTDKHPPITLDELPTAPLCHLGKRYIGSYMSCHLI